MSSSTPGIRYPERFYIDGEWVVPSSKQSFEVLDSATEEPFMTFALADEADMQRAVDAARRAFDAGPWPRLSHAERAEYLRKIGEGVRQRTPDLAHAWSCEVGMVNMIAQFSTAALGDAWDYYAAMAETFPFVEERTPAPMPLPGGDFAYLVQEPVGVVGAIIPWNVPPMLITYKLAPALLAGCTVVLKSSPEAPAAGQIFAEIIEEVGLPPGVVNVVNADREVSESLVRNPGVDKISFTGSTLAGRRIASLCGERIARCTVELGGKSAGIILDDYDLQKAAADIVMRGTFASGQACASLTRMIVSRHRHDEFVEALGAAFSQVPVGNPFDEGVFMGPLVSARQLERVQGYIQKGIAEGATLATGGGRPEGLDRGYFVAPTVFGNVDNRSAIGQEEIFGPVISVIPADSEEHALELANDTIYGLNNSVFTTDADKAWAFARRLKSGTVGHNAMHSDLTLAFGGFKQSGIGREGGVEGLKLYLETKTIILDEKPSSV